MILAPFVIWTDGDFVLFTVKMYLFFNTAKPQYDTCICIYMLILYVVCCTAIRICIGTRVQAKTNSVTFKCDFVLFGALLFLFLFAALRSRSFSSPIRSSFSSAVYVNICQYIQQSWFVPNTLATKIANNNNKKLSQRKREEKNIVTHISSQCVKRGAKY